MRTIHHFLLWIIASNRDLYVEIYPLRDFFSRNIFRLERIRRPRTIGIGISFRGEKEGKEGEVGKSNKVETIPRIFVPFPDREGKIITRAVTEALVQHRRSLSRLRKCFTVEETV